MRTLAPSAVPAGVKRLADVPYGPDPRQRIDVYLPVQAADASTLARESGTKPGLGTVALDSAALDLERLMKVRHMRFYESGTIASGDAAVAAEKRPHHQRRIGAFGTFGAR